MTDSSDVILQRMMALHPKIIDLTLDRVWRLLDRLGNPQNDLPPVIHIAGTNGKGSTQAMIRAGIEAAGGSVHAYTSPHLARFHERVRVGGKLISEPALAAVLDECYAANGDVPITYFEITTCAALLAFARHKADYTLLEVGLGGRLDATNVVNKPCMSVITPVSLDHQQFLGETLEEIAGEKAGILKRNTPAVIGPQEDAAMDVIEARAARIGATPLYVHNQHWRVRRENDRLVYEDETGLRDLSLPNLPGAHQVENAGIALAVLRHLNLGDAAYDGAVKKADWPARMQRLNKGLLADRAPDAELWLDGGHNPAAGEALAKLLSDLPKRPTYLICGMLNTKDVSGYLKPLGKVADNLVAVSIPGEAATLSAEDTARHAENAGLTTGTASEVKSALDQITAQEPRARVLICGSLYLAGEVLRQNQTLPE
ncbi:MAG: folylpolyglutamate synthase/dihydrofolate synthase family protein [Arenibacterium sp.]